MPLCTETSVEFLSQSSNILPFPVESDISKYTAFITAPGEHRQGDRDRNVDTDLANIDFALEAPGGCSGLSEDCGSVSVAVLVDDLDSLVEAISLENYQHRSENLGSKHNNIVRNES